MLTGRGSRFTLPHSVSFAFDDLVLSEVQYMVFCLGDLGRFRHFQTVQDQSVVRLAGNLQDVTHR